MRAGIIIDTIDMKLQGTNSTVITDDDRNLVYYADYDALLKMGLTVGDPKLTGVPSE